MTTRASRLTIGQRLFLGLAPALLAVALVGGLAWYGKYERQAPELIVLEAAVLAIASLVVTWLNARAIARRIGRLAGSEPAVAWRSGTDNREDELDRIEATVDRLGNALSLSEAERLRENEVAGARVREEAALLAATCASAIGRLDELRLPLHILLDNQFGELNENQIELLADARAAAEQMDAELRRLRAVADIDRGAVEGARELVQVNEVIRSVMPGAVAVARRHGGRLDVALEPVLPRVYADRARLHEAIALLLGDAIAPSAAAGPDAQVVAVTTVRRAGSVVVAFDVRPARLVGEPSPDAILAARLLEVQGAVYRRLPNGDVELTLACPG